MPVVLISRKIKPAGAAELEAAAKRMFAALDRTQPEGIRYAAGKLGDGVTYVALVQLDDGVPNPLPALPEFQEFQAGLQQWIDEEPPAAPQPMTIVGSYRLF